MENSIRAIETEYKGYRFRSRLEARYAVFFDALGVKWEYEKEGYQLRGGIRYLPDFWLPDYYSFIEIKGEDANAEERNKAYLLNWDTTYPVYIAEGPLEPPYIMRGFWEGAANDGGGFMANMVSYWVYCSKCDIPTIATDTECLWIWHNDEFGSDFLPCKHSPQEMMLTPSHPIIERAYDKARKARFEFGEKG